MQIAYVDGPRLRRSLVAACEYAQRQRAELNRINVFPVPDGDTGTNLALTVRAISDHLRGNDDRAVAAVAREAAEAAVLGARGNCGMMLSHFLLGFADRVEERYRITPRECAAALEAGADRLADALERPVEGTILTVVRDTARAATESPFPDFAPFVRHLLERARESLKRTPSLLPALAEAGVVDAGAKGFVSLLEGVVLYMHGDPVVEAAGNGDFGEAAPAARIEFPEETERFRYCTEALVRGDDLPSGEEVRARLRADGDSLIVIRSGSVLKVHVHTDEPEIVFSYLRTLGTLATHKAEDMHAQHETVERAAAGHVRLARRPVSVVTDSASDLPEEIVRAHGIQVVPLVLVSDGKAYRDGVDITSDEFVELMVADRELPTTSQPPPAAFLEGFRRAADDGEAVVGVVLGSSLSGTFASAEAAAGRFEEAPVHLMDSLGASLLEGLLVLKAAELAELAWTPDRIVEELGCIRARSGILFTVDSFDRLLASGRVGKGRAWLGSLLGVKPILELTPEGRVAPAGKALGRKRVLPHMMRALEERIPDTPEAVRFGVVHVGCPEIVAPVSEELRRRRGRDVEILAAPATPVVSTHLGPGAWGVAYLVED